MISTHGPSSSVVVGLIVVTLFVGCNQPGSETTPEPDDVSHAMVFGFGRPATTDEIARLDVDVMPDGSGLPDGSGTVAAGENIYRTKCLACHGPTGVEGPWDVLVGRVPNDEFPFGERRAPLTIGSYWPYAPPLFDYIRRSMPFDAPGSMTDDEVYAVTALLLHWNDLLDRETTLNAQILSGIEMPARNRFVMDDRVGGPEVR